MKLRNKRTGEIYSAWSIRVGEEEITSVKQFNDTFEDYEPKELKEPLIKDEKVRKAVRAWAGANELSGGLKVFNEHFDSCKIIGRCDSRNVCLEIEFKTTIAHVNKNQNYTIAELCGDSKEEE